MRRRPAGWFLLLFTSVWGCGGGSEPSGPGGDSATLSFAVEGLVPLDGVTEGRYVAWATDGAGRHQSLGTLAVGTSGTASLDTPFPTATPAFLLITVEPPGTGGTTPSDLHLLQGEWHGGRATLSVVGAITRGGQPLKEVPGQFTMFSPSDNHMNGYPSFEECGVWLFNIAPRLTPQNDAWVRLTPLTPGWTYEGWMVRDHGAAGAIWLSYGKFLPDESGAVAARDNTGWGPFSGVDDFATAGEEEFPGDDWFANPLGFPFPAALSLPLDLREKDASGAGRWTHIITIEPRRDMGEAFGSERPFAIRPYRDTFGDAGPGSPRAITFRADGVPTGEATRQ
jgi:hypothetical protein